MRWFWQKKIPEHFREVAELLPEYIFYQGRTWGLRVKKEKGKWATRYVTKNEPVARGYASMSARKDKHIDQSMRNMVRYLHARDLMKHAVTEPIYPIYPPTLH